MGVMTPGSDRIPAITDGLTCLALPHPHFAVRDQEPAGLGFPVLARDLDADSVDTADWMTIRAEPCVSTRSVVSSFRLKRCSAGPSRRLQHLVDPKSQMSSDCFP